MAETRPLGSVFLGLAHTHMSFTSIPFKADKHDGLSSVNGVAKFSSAGVVIEFEAKLFGLISNGVKEARIAMSEIHAIKFKKGVFKRGAKIELRLNSYAQLAAMPHKDGKITLKIFADDFEAARDAVARIEADLMAHTAELPPPHQPLRSLFDDSEADTKKLD